MSKKVRAALLVALVLAGIGFLDLWTRILWYEVTPVQANGSSPHGEWWWLAPLIAGWLCIATAVLWLTRRAPTPSRELFGIIAFAVWVVLGLFAAGSSVSEFVYFPG